MLHPSRNSTTAYQERRARRHDEPATWPRLRPTTPMQAWHLSPNHGGVVHPLGGAVHPLGVGSIGARCHVGGERRPPEWDGRKREAGADAARQCRDHDASKARCSDVEG